MALTPDQDAYFRSKLGSGYDEDDAEERLIRLGGDGYESGVVVEVLQQRLSDLAGNPLSFTIVGDYSEDRSNNVKLIQKQLVDALEEAGAAGQGVATVYIQEPSYVTDYDQVVLETEELRARRGSLPGGR